MPQTTTSSTPPQSSTSTAWPHEPPSVQEPARPKHPLPRHNWQSIPTIEARMGHIIPGFTNNLLSLGKLCDAGCTAFMNRHRLLVHDSSGKQILTGTREPTSAWLWRVNIAPPPHPQVHLATTLPKPHVHIIPDIPEPPQQSPTPRPPTAQQQQITLWPSQVPIIPDHPNPSPSPKPTRTTTHSRAYDLPSVPALIAYLHATAGYPVKSTWLAAVKREAFASWLGLTPGLVACYCPDSVKTHKGHMAQPRQHICSTRQTTPASNHPAQSTIEIRKIPLTHLFTDDTGRFNPRAQSGNQYIMVGLHTASNAILVCLFASKCDSHQIPAYNNIYARLNAVGAAPTIHVMDNKASMAFQRAVATNKCKLQLVPPHVHRHNAAERAIRTFKDHFLAILAGTPPSLPAN
jgi:hypothetical protein